MEKLLSFIIPVYNTGKILKDLIDKLSLESSSDIEFVIVNDGSKDTDTINILNEINDPNFVIINKENRGVSSARNVGLKNSHGKYVLFFDSDDELIISVKDIKNALITNYDYYVFDILVDNKNQKLYEKYGELSSKEAIKDLFGKYDTYKGYVYSRIIKRNILIDNNIFFDEDIFYNEDRLFVYKTLLSVDKIYHTDLVYYNYILNPNGAMSKSKIVNEKTLTEYVAFDRAIDITNDKDILDKIRKEAFSTLYAKSILKGNYKLLKPLIKKYYKEIKNKELYEILRYHFTRFFILLARKKRRGK